MAEATGGIFMEFIHQSPHLSIIKIGLKTIPKDFKETDIDWFILDRLDTSTN